MSFFDQFACANPITNEQMAQNMIDAGIAEADIKRWIGEGHEMKDLYDRWINLEKMPN